MLDLSWNGLLLVKQKILTLICAAGGVYDFQNFKQV